MGRTIQTLSIRLSVHRSDYKAYIEGKPRSYCSSFKVLEHGDASIELIEETDDASREYYRMHELDSCNIQRNDYDQKAHMAAYRVANKVAILNQQAVWYEANRETILKHKAVHYEANKEIILKKKAVYDEANKAAIAKRKAERVLCPNCGRDSLRYDLWFIGSL